MNILALEIQSYKKNTFNLMSVRSDALRIIIGIKMFNGIFGNIISFSSTISLTL